MTDELKIDEEARIYKPHVLESMINKTEFNLLHRLRDSYINKRGDNKHLYHIFDYTLDSYNCFKDVMNKEEAKKTAMFYGIERIIAEYRHTKRNI